MTWFDPPWRVEPSHSGMFNIVSGSDYFDKDIIAFTANGAPEEVAHKIAAAPEMYAALARIRVWLSGLATAQLAGSENVNTEAVKNDLAQVDDSLAKARGEQSHKGRAAANNCRPGE